MLPRGDITVCDRSEDGSRLRGEGLGVRTDTFSQSFIEKKQPENGAGGLWFSPAEPFKVMPDRMSRSLGVESVKKEALG